MCTVHPGLVSCSFYAIPISPLLIYKNVTCTTVYRMHNIIIAADVALLQAGPYLAGGGGGGGGRGGRRGNYPPRYVHANDN